MERIINIEAHVRRWQLELGKAVEIIADKERKNIKLESAAIQECGFDDGVFPSCTLARHFERETFMMGSISSRLAHEYVEHMCK